MLANPGLGSILLYHVLSGTILSNDLSNGTFPTLNGESITVDLSSGVMINTSMVTTPDLQVDNGVVHVIDAVLLPMLSSSEEIEEIELNIYPNPASDKINIDAKRNAFQNATIYDMTGRTMIKTIINENGFIDVSSLEDGAYIIRLISDKNIATQKLQIFK